MSDSRPIGVFDSGVGGLTVLREMRRQLPAERLLYVADLAHFPYGPRPQRQVRALALDIIAMLVTMDTKLVVVACNTASALALPRLQETLSVSVTGVVFPGAQAAVSATRNGHIGVIGTRATINSGAYERAIQSISAEVRVTSHACPLLVPLIEEGWLNNDITDQMIHHYLDPLLSEGIDTLVLGCTHYPLLRPAFARILGPEISLVDSAQNCASAVRDLLMRENLQTSSDTDGVLEVALTDPPDNFLQVARDALQLDVGEIQLREVAHGAVK